MLWPTLIPVLALVIEQFSGQISAYLAGHPTVALVAVTVVTALANIVNPKK
jgi:hypothetical protein